MSTTTKDGYRRTETGYLEPTQDLIRKNRQKPSKEDYFFRNISGENEKSIAEYCLKDGKALLMKGPPGCGKTAFAMWFAKEKGLGFYRVPCNEDTTTRDFFGSLAPDSTGEFIVSPGPVLKGIMDGQAVILIDDFNLADKNIVAALHPVLDSRQFTNPLTFENYDLSPSVIIMFAMNPGGMYALESSPALKRRPLAIRFDYLPKETAIEMALSKLESAYAKDSTVRRVADGIWDGVYDLRKVHANNNMTPDGTGAIPMVEKPGDGTIIDALKMWCSGFSIEVAAKVAIAERIISDTATDAEQRIMAIVDIVKSRVPNQLQKKSP